ncbi:hypothetical protein [Haloplanus pelagicus]|jgi:hypothetical protein|uniref:hypothetical protein n=1 Tax=Haloplanus pelagicus TaxID=2949995 RepID=UPI00203F6893|nr:hypothetical protein [Haloplanus sp. HW8-1]
MIEERRRGCPLCARAVDDRTELRIHLMVDHRKSAVIDEYVDWVEGRVVTP